MTVRRVFALLGGGAAALLTGLAVTLGVAWAAPWPVLFLTAGLAAGVSVWLGAVRLAGGPTRRWQVAGALAAVVLLGSVLVPLGDPVREPATPPGAGTWTLADGETLAYGVVRASPGTERRTPVVMLHGGPGVPDLAGQLTALAPLADDGHDVWSYAQRGTGASSRLSDPRGYSLEQDVADLEEVRQLIGAPELILVGHSYGAVVAVAYLADHPGRVEKAVFSAPGDLAPDAPPGQPQSRLDSAQRRQVYALVAPPRAMLTYGLVQVNPVAARAFAGDREVDARQDRVYAAALPGLHCVGDGTPLHGLGFYANAVPQSMRQPPIPDVRPAVRGSDVPVLVIKPQCDYLDWQSATGYLDLFPDSTMVYLPGAGHQQYLDLPERFTAAVRAFLDGGPVPDTLAEPWRAPADYQP